MTDRERVIGRLRRLIRTAHNENYDFVYIPVGTAKVIVRMLEEQEAERNERKETVFQRDRAGSQQ